MRRVCRRCSPRREEVGESRLAARFERAAGRNHRDTGRDSRGDRPLEPRAVGREYEAGRQSCDDVPELGEVRGDQRVGRRDRRIGNADILRGKPDQRMLDVVAGKDRDRPLRREIEVEERGADATDAVERLGIGEGAPFAVRVALRQLGAVRRRHRKVNEPVGQLVGVGAERAALADEHNLRRAAPRFRFRASRSEPCEAAPPRSRRCLSLRCCSCANPPSAA